MNAKARWMKIIAILISLAAITGYAWLFNLVDMRATPYLAYGPLIPLVMLAAGLPLVMAEILARWQHRPMRLKVDWPTLLIYGLPALMLAEIGPLYFLVRLPPILSGAHSTLIEQLPVTMAAAGFMVGIAVAKAVRIEAREASDLGRC
jgi:hypothetical protein